MKNWKYRIDNNDIILSDAEHEKIKQGIKDKLPIIELREGSLAVNPSFIRFYSRTDKNTEPEEKERLKKFSQSSAGLRPVGEWLANHHNDFYERMGWEHAENCSCRKGEAKIK